MHVIEEFDVNGYHVEILPDEDCSNPHEDDVHFLLLEFSGQSDGMGDETVDPERMEVDCDCDGGFRYNEATAATDIECDKCYDGRREVESMAEIIDWVTKEYDAILVVPVRHTSQSYSIYRLTHDGDEHAWGLMVYTKAHQEMWGSSTDPDEIRKMMEADLAEYSDWASGFCQGYRIFDMTGREVDACWGFIGSDEKGDYWAASEARAVAEGLPGPDDQRLEWALAWV